MATVNDLLIKVRRKINDMQKLKYNDEELISILNDAIENVSAQLASELYPEMIRTLTIAGVTQVTRPNQFINFVGQYPIKFIVDDTGAVFLKHIDDNFADSMIVRYFASMDKVENLTDTIPFSKLGHQNMLVNNMIAQIVPPNTVEKEGNR